MLEHTWFRELLTWQLLPNSTVYLLGGRKYSFVVNLKDSPISTTTNFISRGVDSMENKCIPRNVWLTTLLEIYK